MRSGITSVLLLLCVCFSGAVFYTARSVADGGITAPSLGRVEIFTMPIDANYWIRSATYTPSGKVLVSFARRKEQDRRDIDLVVVEDDGSGMRPVFSGKIPHRGKDNGLRFMVFADNQRIFLGDFIIECLPDIDACKRSTLLPVEYPPEVAGGDHVAHRWSEIIVAPDNEHIAWTTLFADYSAAVFTGKLEKTQAGYRIVSPRITSTLDAFPPDPGHADGVVPQPVNNGEVKQFVAGGTAISMVGAMRRDTADTVVRDLVSGAQVQITDTPGYTETTIFSPDERLGIVMSTRFSARTNMAILGLMPRPYAANLNMGLNMYAYTYSVTGVRISRQGNIGPVLVDIAASRSEAGYRGVNLHTQDDWVYYSPMSWHPGGKKAMWLEGMRGETGLEDGGKRIQVVRLLDYKPGLPVPARTTPDSIPGAVADLSVVRELLARGNNIDVRVYGRHSGHIEYRRFANGAAIEIEKRYENFSDDGESVYSGREQMHSNPGGYSTYTARVVLTGPKPGVMDLAMTFGPLRGPLPAELIFAADDPAVAASRGYSEYNGQTLNVDSLVP